MEGRVHDSIYCPRCGAAMQRFEGVPIAMGNNRAVRNVGWSCKSCGHDINEGWQVLRIREKA